MPIGVLGLESKRKKYYSLIVFSPSTDTEADPVEALCRRASELGQDSQLKLLRHLLHTLPVSDVGNVVAELIKSWTDSIPDVGPFSASSSSSATTTTGSASTST